jgi:hypothetical protein
MGNSIQDYLRKINSRLTISDCVSIAITALCSGVFALYIYHLDKSSMKTVMYTEGNINEVIYSSSASNKNPSTIFGSLHGSTYTFTWCQGASHIAVKNRIYFSDENSAKSSGRTLSKLCK